jgi:3D (Asp-Asp-Asp) domain-containing protein
MAIVSVTAYCYPDAGCPESSKGRTASGIRVRDGILAVSRDLEEGMNLGFGDRVLLHGLGVFEFQDRTSARLHKRADIYISSRQQAHCFGVRRYVVLVKLT